MVPYQASSFKVYTATVGVIIISDGHSPRPIPNLGPRCLLGCRRRRCACDLVHQWSSGGMSTCAFVRATTFIASRLLSVSDPKLNRGGAWFVLPPPTEIPMRVNMDVAITASEAAATWVGVLMFPKLGSNRTAVSQIPKIWPGRTEPEPNFENITGNWSVAREWQRQGTEKR